MNMKRVIFLGLLTLAVCISYSIGYLVGERHERLCWVPSYENGILTLHPKPPAVRFQNANVIRNAVPQHLSSE